MTNKNSSIVDARSWGSHIPSSVQAAREYYRYVDPRNFFQLIAPLNQLFILLALIVCWKDAVSLRYYFGIPFLLYAAIFLLTRFYFVPRDVILFASANQYSNEQIKAVLNQWERMNWVRASSGIQKK